jgi:hypothetical protein
MRGGIGDVDDQVGQGHLFERGPERLHEVVGQLPDEPDRVGDHSPAPAR